MAPSTSGAEALEGNSLLDGFRLMRASIPQMQEAGMSASDLADVLRGAPSPAGPLFGDVLHDDAMQAMAEAMLPPDASVLAPLFDGTSVQVFYPNQPLPLTGTVLA